LERLDPHTDDPLSKLLRVVNVHSSVYCVSDLRAPWGFRVEDSTPAKFHLPLEGRCTLMLTRGERLNLERGELALLPFGTGHTVRDRFRDSEVPELAQLLSEHPPDRRGRLRYGGRGRRTLLACGGFLLADALPARLLAALPPVIKVDFGSDSLLNVLRNAANDPRPGGSAVFAKIADVFLTELLRTYLLAAERDGRIQVGPLGHPAIARAIELMRNRPEERWTVACLAHEVGLSRTLFMARFRDLVGQAPVRYLTRVRLTQAAGHLATTDETLYGVARRAGYESEASFSKAFKREFGVTPGAYRRQSVERPITVDPETPGG
jgi:AraC family transcriptional regulator, activator of mtrCDE